MIRFPKELWSVQTGGDPEGSMQIRADADDLHIRKPSVPDKGYRNEKPAEMSPPATDKGTVLVLPNLPERERCNYPFEEG